MDERTHGIVLRTRPLTESSLIVHWLTPDFGRIATAAKGARRPKSPFRGKLDLFYRCEFTFARSRRSDLHALREVLIKDMHPSLRRELGWLDQAAYATELIELTTETESPLPELFELYAGFLRHLPTEPPRPRSVFAFEMKLLAELGQFPDLASSNLTSGARQLLSDLTELDWPKLASLKPSTTHIREAQRFLQDFLIFHLGRTPKTRNAAVSGN